MSFLQENKKELVKISMYIIPVLIGVSGKSIYDKKGYDYFLLVLIVALVFLAFYAFNLFLLYNLQIEKIGGVVDRYVLTHELKDSDWYYNMDELEHFEFDEYISDTDNKKKEIWVISRYLEHDHPNSHLHKKIRGNVINHKVKYRYVIPNSDDKELSLKTTKLYFEFTKELKINNPFCVINNEAFDYPCDILIFHNSEYDKLTVFMELRVTKDPEKRKWAKIENSSARRVFNNILSDLENKDTHVEFSESKFKGIMQYS